MKYTRNHVVAGTAINPVLQMVVFILAIALLALLGYRQLDRVLTPRKTVVVLAKPLEAGEQLTADHLGLANLNAQHLSDATIVDPGAAIGRALSRSKQKGEPLYPSDLTAVAKGPRVRLAEIVPAGRVLTTLMLTNMTLPPNELKRGDRVDILAAGPTRTGGRNSAVIVHDAEVISYLSPPVRRSQPAAKGIMNLAKATPASESKIPPGLLLAVLPTDVLPLAEIDGSGVHLTLALHNRKTVEEGNMLTIKRNKSPRYIDLIVGEDRESVQVQ